MTDQTACNPCASCGRLYGDWVCKDYLWNLVVPEDGLWCPECFIDRAWREHQLDEWTTVLDTLALGRALAEAARVLGEEGR